MRGPNLGLRTILFLGLSIAAIVFDHQTEYLQKIRSTLTDLVAPVQHVVNWPVAMFDWITTSITTRSQLISDNASLRAQQVLLTAQLETFLALQKENNQLRALLASTPNIDTSKFLVAQVLAVASAPFLQQIVIDHGTNTNVYVGQAVVDTNGIVGQVIQTSDYTSRVMLLSDSLSSIPVEDTRSNVLGIVNGSGNPSKLFMINMPLTADIQVGDPLVSSGLGLRYPIGYPVGVVTKIIRDPTREFMEILVKPAARLQQSRLVLLIWPKEQKVIESAQQQIRQLQQLAKQGQEQQ